MVRIRLLAWAIVPPLLLGAGEVPATPDYAADARSIELPGEPLFHLDGARARAVRSGPELSRNLADRSSLGIR